MSTELPKRAEAAHPRTTIDHDQRKALAWAILDEAAQAHSEAELMAAGFDETLGPAGTPGRDSQGEVVLIHRLRDVLRSINSGVPGAAIETAIERLTENRSAMDRVRQP